MRRILAVETDPKRQQALTTLVRHVQASLVIVASVRAAIASIEERTPDLIIAPTLLSPPDEAELLTHMKGLDSAPYIQMLTLPALDMLVDAPAETPRWGSFASVFNLRPASQGPQYDPDMIAAEIADALTRARTLRLQYATTLAFNEAMSGRPAQETSLVLAGRGGRELLEVSSARVEPHLRDHAGEERRVASRKARGDVPWLSGIKVSWGPELQVINISSSGVLVETGLKFAPGSTTNLQLCGPETNLVVPVRFIRSTVARVDGLGVRYRAAAAFAKELDLDRHETGAGGEGRTHASASDALAALFGRVISDTDDEPAHVRFARGLRQLVGAKEVHVNTGRADFSAARGMLSFDVPGDDRSRTTLQVLLDRDRDVTDVEFRILKAAAWLTAAVLEFEKPVSPPAAHSRPMALIAGRVA